MNLVALTPAVPETAIIFPRPLRVGSSSAAIFSLGRFASEAPQQQSFSLGRFASNAAEELPMRSGMALCDRRA